TGYCLVVKQYLLTGWKGMGLRGYGDRYFTEHDQVALARLGCVVELVWNSTEAGRISVSRSILSLTAKAVESIKWLEQRCVELRRSFLAKTQKSAYASLNRRLLDAEISGDVQLNWVFLIGSGAKREAKWG